VYDSRYDFLSYSTLAYDEDAQISGSHLQSDAQHVVEGFAVAHDVVTLFNGL
jgi:hypothetical protein